MKTAKETRLFRMVQIVCAIVFTIFAFTFLAVYQAPLLEVVYDMTATGRLEYNEYVTAVAITAILLLLSLWLNRFAKFRREWEAMSYLPACVVLAFITNIDRTIYTGGEKSWDWLWIALVTLFVYVFAAWILRRVLFVRIKNVTRATNRIMWRNFLLFTALFCLTGFLSECDENFKHEAMIYHYVKRGDYDRAKKVASRSFNASKELTVERAYLLAHDGELGETLFAYPQYYGVSGLLPDLKHNSPLSASLIYDFLNIPPKSNENSVTFLRNAVATDTASIVIKDYYLCALLLDKRLKEFSNELSRFYDVTDASKLPKHYKEALMLYAKTVDNYVLPFKDEDLEKSYSDFVALENMYDDLLVRSNYVKKAFGSTYWRYYIYESR